MSRERAARDRAIECTVSIPDPDDIPRHARDADEPEALLERAARGDREAVLALYDRCAPTVLAVAMRVLGNRGEAEDVVQEVFTRAWREAGSFDRARGSALGWLVTLARNRAIDLSRARTRRARHEDAQRDEEPVVAEAPADPEHAVADAQRAAAVRMALDTLRPEQREVLELAYFGGLSHSEVAERLGQPLGTVKTRIAQSVKRLREALSRFAPAAGSRDAEPS